MERGISVGRSRRARNSRPEPATPAVPALRMMNPSRGRTVHPEGERFSPAGKPKLLRQMTSCRNCTECGTHSPTHRPSLHATPNRGMPTSDLAGRFANPPKGPHHGDIRGRHRCPPPQTYGSQRSGFWRTPKTAAFGHLCVQSGVTERKWSARRNRQKRKRI
jgi:hypothetical protein